MTVNKGAIQVSNDAGSVDVEEGSSYSVSSNTKPERCNDEIESKTNTDSGEKSSKEKKNLFVRTSKGTCKKIFLQSVLNT